MGTSTGTGGGFSVSVADPAGKILDFTRVVQKVVSQPLSDAPRTGWGVVMEFEVLMLGEDNQPLIIVDGVVFSTRPQEGSTWWHWSNNDYGDKLNDFNDSDI